MSDILSWGLPGGSVKDTETINQALNRIAQNINKNIIIGDVEPVTLIESIFNYGDENLYIMVWVLLIELETNMLLIIKI